jgi:hypothetical protein
MGRRREWTSTYRSRGFKPKGGGIRIITFRVTHDYQIADNIKPLYLTRVVQQHKFFISIRILSTGYFYISDGLQLPVLTCSPARADFLLWWFVWGNMYPYEIYNTGYLRSVLNFVCGRAKFEEIGAQRFRSFIFGLTCIGGEFYPGSSENSITGQNPPLVPTQQQWLSMHRTITSILRKIREIEA